MTEAQAKLLWCPQKAVLNTGADACKAGPAPCIGSGCMAWRLGTIGNPTTGFCGLAGSTGAL